MKRRSSITPKMYSRTHKLGPMLALAFTWFFWLFSFLLFLLCPACIYLLWLLKPAGGGRLRVSDLDGLHRKWNHRHPVRFSRFSRPHAVGVLIRHDMK